MKAATPLSLSSALALLPRGAAGANNIPPLEGRANKLTTTTRESEQDNNQQIHREEFDYYAAGGKSPLFAKLFEASEDAATGKSAGYEYRLQINATLPLQYDRSTGEPIINQCVDWAYNSNPDNFTWYGLRIQLPEDAATGSGGYFTDVTKATQELGLVQQFNSTPPMELLEYNITTKESQPTIRINFNDLPFWETYTFDFVEQGSVVSDGIMYQEFKRTMNGAVTCYDVPEEEWPKRVLKPVIPTLTISLQRFDNGGSGSGGASDAPPTPSPPTNSAVEPCGSKKLFLSLSFAAIAAVWTMTTFV